ncbi:hypothetical protein KTO58_27360 [Chitinophaga pendula]|uniref:hypothetical protein n=1 Tax=Chitinophaga TaxID=79328 RepID=UPI000BB02645|nr:MULTISPECIES: hypothetical protein [Chitinophaga]ASZ09721.1 hypothetical protein CK934_01395 [Chitinophaga sp. MD30]UCJ07335.1 hypothetical protein KTO58_27360 [Chitinophaga pendula]
MKKTALIAAAGGILIALLAYSAHSAGLLGVKAFFKLGIAGLLLMIAAAAYFIVSALAEWARETDFFRKIL